jgi:hypothetical protein
VGGSPGGGRGPTNGKGAAIELLEATFLSAPRPVRCGNLVSSARSSHFSSCHISHEFMLDGRFAALWRSHAFDSRLIGSLDSRAESAL